LHAMVVVLSCLFGAVSHSDSWWSVSIPISDSVSFCLAHSLLFRCDWLATADLHCVQRWLPHCFR
jgi:hypothetical protein